MTPPPLPQGLELWLPNDLEVWGKRTFDAPRRLVWECHTAPALVRRWLLGPDGWSMPVCEIDLRQGGRYRYVWRHVDGREMGVAGVFREVVPPERLVATQRYDAAPAERESLLTQLFAEHEGRTTLTLTLRYGSKAARDAAFAAGMLRGMEVNYVRLEQLMGDAAAGPGTP